MRPYPFALAAVLAFAMATPSHAAKKPLPQQASQQQLGQAKHIWNNEDMDRLRSQGLITTFDQPAIATGRAPSPATATEESARAPRPPQLQDPEWYRQQAADLQAALDLSRAELNHAQQSLANAKEGVTEPGIAMDRGNPGITPESGIDVLEARVREVQSELDELSDLARQNGIAPSVLRG